MTNTSESNEQPRGAMARVKSWVESWDMWQLLSLSMIAFGVILIPSITGFLQLAWIALVIVHTWLLANRRSLQHAKQLMSLVDTMVAANSSLAAELHSRGVPLKRLSDIMDGKPPTDPPAAEKRPIGFRKEE